MNRIQPIFSKAKRSRSILIILGILRPSCAFNAYKTACPCRPILSSLSASCHSMPDNEAVSSVTCVIFPSEESNQDLARSLADKLNLTLLDEDETMIHSSSSIHFTHSLHFVPYRNTFALAIRPFLSKQSTNKKTHTVNPTTMQPFFVDFCPVLDTRMGKRLYRDNQPTELLLKAIYTKKIRKDLSTSSVGPVIFDLTAGLAQDALLMVHGHESSQVHLVERHPIVAELLEDALRRTRLIASQDLSTSTEEQDSSTIRYARDLQSRLSLHKMNAISFIQAIQSPSSYSSSSSIEDFSGIEKPDICYLDPMFPPRTKSAAVKKNMQILHGLLHSNPRVEEESDFQKRLLEEQALLDAALSISKSRVVVKRPMSADILGGKNYPTTPSYSLQGSINRWDVYVLS